MRDELKGALDEVRAEDALVAQTLSSVLAYGKNQGKRSAKNRVLRMATAALCLLALIVGGVVFHSGYTTASAYVDLDINPSIELTLNRYNRVISAHAYNEDGLRILEGLGLEHKSYQGALSVLVAALEEQGYLADGETLTITVQSERTGEALASSVGRSAHTILEEHHSGARADVYMVDTQTKSHAHNLGISPARYLAILALQEADPTITFEDCLAHSLGELQEYAAGHHESEGAKGGTEGGRAPEAGKGHHAAEPS